MRRAVALVSALLAATPAMAADWMNGEWCTLAGELFFVDDTGIGFNEHTVCTWPTPPHQPPFISVLYCSNLYPQGDQIVAGFHQTRTIAVEPEGENTLRVTLGETSWLYERCNQ